MFLRARRACNLLNEFSQHHPSHPPVRPCCNPSARVQCYSIATSVDYQGLSTEGLLRECIHHNQQAAWDEFIRRYYPVISHSVLKSVRRWQIPSQDVVADLTQDTFLKLCKDGCSILRNFRVESEDSLRAFLKVVAANVVRDYFKREMAARHGGGVTSHAVDAAASVADNISAEADIDRNLLLSHVQECLNRCVNGRHRERDKQIFWLRFRHGFSADEIAALPNIGLKTKGVESTLLRIIRQLRNQLGGEQGKSSL